MAALDPVDQAKIDALILAFQNAETSMNTLISDIGTGVDTSAATSDQLIITDATSQFNNKIIGIDGSVGSPGYAFLNDPDTGWYRIGSGHMGWASDGVKAFEIGNNGITTDKDLVVGDSNDATTSNITLYGGSISPGKITLARRQGLARYRMEVYRTVGDNNETNFEFQGPTTDEGAVSFIMGNLVGDASDFNVKKQDGTSILRLQSNGNMIPAGEIDASAGGIKLGGTAAANLLDDYEEGTWTPALTFAAGSGTITYSLQEGTYTKVGDTISIRGRMTLTSIASRTGNVDIIGLPFTSYNQFQAANAAYASGMSITAGQSITAVITNSSTIMRLYLWDLASGVSNLQDTEISDTLDIMFEATYKVA